MANINVEVILSIFFLTFSNANIEFVRKKLICRFYTTFKALPTTKQVDFINKKEFDKAVLNKDSKTFMVHIIALKALRAKMAIYLAQTALITSDDSIQVPTL